MKNLKLYGDQLIIGKGSLKYLEKIEENRIFIVTGGKSAFENGSIDKLKKYFDMHYKTYKIYSGIKKNPDTNSVLNAISDMEKFKPDLILAIGGGSAIDAAKVMTLFYDYKDLTFDNILLNDISNYRRKTKFIAVPSTSGTGTEVTKAAVITFKEKNIKIGLKSMAFIPDIAILDANLTLSMPANIVAETGMDALTHALEAYTNHNLDDFTEVIAKGAIEGLLKYLEVSYKGESFEAREKVHYYQSMAGMAFHNVGLGMAHGISHAFGGKYNYGHGLLNAICLPYVLNYNKKNDIVNEKLKYLSDFLRTDDIVDEVFQLNDALNIPKSFLELGLSENQFYNDLDDLVVNCLKGSTVSNPIDMNATEMKKILIQIFNGYKKK
ncbi:iron-containing alcohol dehydrogenase [Clostridiaceae bacterium HSG29]|nr:iron-containing alcohol dehydrogenase [Clostridiaceae bacterium HSG29]